MKFLIDECLSTGLAALARERGYPESTHVTWLGLRTRQDWALVRRALADRYVLVTNDKGDFAPLMERERRHPGLTCITVAHGMMSLYVQARLFEHGLRQLAGPGYRGQDHGDRARRGLDSPGRNQRPSRSGFFPFLVPAPVPAGAI